jgi:glycosyltransferase involved in cell wall biosynthesis
MRLNNTLYLFTEQFPFGLNSEKAFLSNEIKYLKNKFENIIIIPRVINHEQTTIGEFQIDITLSQKLNSKNKILLIIASLSSSYLYKELISKNIIFWNFDRLKKLIYFTARTHQVNNWVKKKIKNNSKENCIFYTYWTNDITLGLVKPAKDNEIKLFSRAHGHDLYEDFYDYLPCYKRIVSGVHKLFPVSKIGYNYLINKYPKHKNKITLSYLGVKVAPVSCSYSKDDHIRIVSCSYIIPLKRINLIISGIQEFIKLYDKKIIWTHFGDGELYDDIKNQAKKVNDERFKYVLKGFIDNNDLLKYYQLNPVDLFITTSESEGVPISLLEAQAHGIPVIGTNVGGIPEIINEKVGILLSTNPKTVEIADAINYISSDKDRFDRMKKNSFSNWEENFNADKNFDFFTTELLSLFKENFYDKKTDHKKINSGDHSIN